jgi:hypothetical protein
VMSFRRPLGLLSCSWATLNLMEFCHEGDLVSNFSVKWEIWGFWLVLEVYPILVSSSIP